MRIKILIIITIIIFIIIILITITPILSNKYIKSEIEKANYCEAKEDCADTKTNKCQFGCNVYVNKNEVDRIRNLINSYDSKCEYECAYCRDVECENNKCKPICPF